MELELFTGFLGFFFTAIVLVIIFLYLYAIVTVYSTSYWDFAIWGLIAILIQLVFAFIVTRLGGKYSFKTKISQGIISVGILMAFLSISIGLLNAGSMSY